MQKRITITNATRKSTVSQGLSVIAVLCAMFELVTPAAAQGDAERGGRAIRSQCLSCHALEPGRHMTGPSLAGVIGRKAGSVQDFDRYSEALVASAVVWSAPALDAFLAEPQKLIPGNTMTALVGDAQTRADIVAYLVATQGPEAERRAGLPVPFQSNLDLKSVGAASRVTKLSLCRDTYSVKTENGVTMKIWERNLRFKTDGSKEGPPTGKPALIPSGRLGDRFYVIFAAPEEISRLIESACAP